VKESYESHRTVVGEAPRSGRVHTSLADFRNTSNGLLVVVKDVSLIVPRISVRSLLLDCPL